ncbi:MAG: metallophosphoesterase, partial [Oscillospiraceae bacterium]|nr:metallophosphoesterase [Oscillospiraceae bacterium]
MRKTTAVILALLVLLASVPFSAAAKKTDDLRIAFISDTHLLPEELTGGYNDAFKEDTYDRGKPAEQSQGLLLSALASLKARAKSEDLDYLVVTGDLTKDGELASHKRLAQLLEQFEKDSGAQVAVIPGNHDINMGPSEYSTGVAQSTPNTSPRQFLQIYKNLGFDLATP